MSLFHNSVIKQRNWNKTLLEKANNICVFFIIFSNLLFLSLSLCDSQHFSLSSSLKMSLLLREKEGILYPRKTTGTFVVAYILFCRIVDKKIIKKIKN